MKRAMNWLGGLLCGLAAAFSGERRGGVNDRVITGMRSR